MSVENLELNVEENPFNKRTQRWLVKKYVLLHADKKIEVDTKIIAIGRKRFKLRKELAILEKQHQLVGSQDSLNERAYWETLISKKERELEHTPSEETYSEVIPDERFKDLPELEQKYRGIIKVPKKAWRQVEEKLYPLVSTLNDEGRIKPPLELPKLPDLLELEELKHQVSELSVTVNAVSFDFKNLRAEAQRRGWPV